MSLTISQGANSGLSTSVDAVSLGLSSANAPSLNSSDLYLALRDAAVRATRVAAAEGGTSNAYAILGRAFPNYEKAGITALTIPTADARRPQGVTGGSRSARESTVAGPDSTSKETPSTDLKVKGKVPEEQGAQGLEDPATAQSERSVEKKQGQPDGGLMASVRSLDTSGSPSSVDSKIASLFNMSRSGNPPVSISLGSGQAAQQPVFGPVSNALAKIRQREHSPVESTQGVGPAISLAERPRELVTAGGPEVAFARSGRSSDRNGGLEAPAPGQKEVLSKAGPLPETGYGERATLDLSDGRRTELGLQKDEKSREERPFSFA